MIDSMLFAVDIPAGTYAAGQEFPLSVIRGPSVVRDGYGRAVLKNVICMSAAAGISLGSHFDVKNANWNDSLKSTVVSMNGNAIALSKFSPCIQKGGDTELQPNSAFDVKLVFGDAATTNFDNSCFVLIDIDYPSVAAVSNPAEEKGLPVTIMRNDTITATANGAAATMAWTTVNVDEFKAGYRYLLTQVGMMDTVNYVGFVAFSGAPSMNGLVRIIPTAPKSPQYCRMELDYSTPLVKGPMNIEYAAVGTAGSTPTSLECDYIRR